jgi:ubiquinone/menaquinone biosynthesis C-methylase UbiE
MLAVAQNKRAASGSDIPFIEGDAMNLSFADGVSMR